MSELKPCPMTADEAISALEMCQSLMLFDPMAGETHELCEENKDNQDLYNACSLAIDALRRAQPANEPLVTRGECVKYQTPNCAAKHEQALMDFCSHGIRKPGGEQT